MANTTEHTFAPADFQDIRFDIMSSSVGTALTADDSQGLDFDMIWSEMEPTLAAPGHEDFVFPMISNAVGLDIAPTGLRGLESNMTTNILAPTLAVAGLQDRGLYTLSNATEPALPITGVRPSGLCTTSNSMETPFVSVDQNFELSTQSSTRPSPPRNDWVSKDEWTPVRPLIKRLYVDEGKTLKEIVAIMEEEHGFKAIPKMYKDRIKTWHFNKNLKQAEIIAILRKKTERDRIGKRSSFQVRGRVVSIEKVDRSFRRRKGITLDALLAKQAQAATPPDIVCWTPPLSPRLEHEVPHSVSTPYSLAIPEQLFFYSDRYMSVSFGNKIWVVTEDGVLINTFMSQESQKVLHDFSIYCVASTNLAERKLFIESRKILSKACTLVPSILKAENPNTIAFFLNIFLYLVSCELREYAIQLMQYISEMANILLPAEHPWGQVCRLMGVIESNHIRESMIRCLEYVNKFYVQCVGQFHETSISIQINLIENSYLDQNLSVGENRLRYLYLQCREATGNSSRIALAILNALVSNLCSQEKYFDAETVAVELLNIAREARSIVFETAGLENVARAQYGQGKLDLTEVNVQEAIGLVGRYWEESDPWVLGMVVRLESLIQEFGVGQKVAELKMERQRRMMLCEITDDELIGGFG